MTDICEEECQPVYHSEEHFLTDQVIDFAKVMFLLLRVVDLYAILHVLLYASNTMPSLVGLVSFPSRLVSGSVVLRRGGESRRKRKQRPSVRRSWRGKCSGG